jgi:hypothetical protein
MSTKHTPGPWNANPKRLIIETQSGPVEGPLMSYLVGNRASLPGTVVSIASERVADHHLCAAAPDLLAALQGLDEAYCRAGSPLNKDERHEDRMRLIAARAAIAKATGEKQ